HRPYGFGERYWSEGATFRRYSAVVDHCHWHCPRVVQRILFWCSSMAPSRAAGTLQGSGRRADAVAQAGNARPLGAMLAAKESPFLLEPVAHDADPASLAFWRQRLDRTFEHVKCMGGTGHRYL